MRKTPLRTLAFILTACEPTPIPTGGPLWAGTYVSIYVDAVGQVPCVGTLPHLDRYIERVFDLMNEAIPDDLNIRVQIVDNLPCSNEAVACYQPEEKTVYINSFENTNGDLMGVLRHELTHALMDSSWGLGIPFFSEGLADGLARSDREATSGMPAPVRQMLDKDASEIDYRLAAHFVRFLIGRFGIVQYKRFHQMTTVASLDRILSNFKAVYGLDFTDIESEYLSEPFSCAFDVDLCDVSRAVPVLTRWSHSFVVSCDDPSYYGAIGEGHSGEGNIMGADFTLDVQSDGVYFLRSEASFAFVSCNSCNQRFFSSGSGFGEEVGLNLRAGLYNVQITLGSGSDGVLSLDLHAAE